MAEDLIRYDILVQDALRGIVRKVLHEVARAGLPGDHHFYISFETGARGVQVSNRIRAKYPKEMTIVLQHQFWDLVVTETSFDVGLSFGGVPEHLHIPFSAVKGFFDPRGWRDRAGGQHGPPVGVVDRDRRERGGGGADR